MEIPFYTSSREYLQRKPEFDKAVQEIMQQGNFILGKPVEEFEQDCAKWLDVKHAIGVANGSDALVIGADLLGFKDGAEVLTPTFTFFASTSCVARLGGKPVFVDLDEETLNMDLADAERRLTPKTKGIIPVHLFCQATDMERTMALAKAHKLAVLEDSAEAFGMKTKVGGVWHSAGTVGELGVYSFFPTKTLGAYGDAGLIVTNNDDLAAKARSYRAHGATKKYHHDYVGYNSRLDTLQAAILRVKMRTIDAAIARRAEIARRYTEQLSDLPGVRFPQVLASNREVYYVYNLLVPRRDDLVDFLKSAGIGTSVYYPKPLHLQKAFEYLGHKAGDFPVAERVCQEIVALPIFPELTDGEVDYVAGKIREFFGKKS